MALLLSFDTATSHLSVVLSEDARPLVWREDSTEKLSHAERLNVFIAEVMEEAGSGLKDLDAVAVGTGPGSYTGLRIGLSAAKGLCFALDKPLIGMGTLEVLLAQFLEEQEEQSPGAVLMPMVDARRMEVYTRTYGTDEKPLDATAPLILDAAWCDARARTGRTYVFGDGADKATALWQAYPAINYVPHVRPGIKGLARCADRYYREGRFGDLTYLVPEYGKPANVAQKRGAE
ncbi:MAG: tRNA (adenosine(37)-N6)-threonylcarbamoyltransferase complex dimerization subunit type 1 TsaB [Flavobacteriales bacterium]|nr:tRNA (adenosine(37)-N6)-threonylcarbamoyltransferase complex dimerization subunit type 1 TsaB [Flavobacteriales bacterium]